MRKQCSNCGWPIVRSSVGWLHVETFDQRQGARACEPDMQSMYAEPSESTDERKMPAGYGTVVHHRDGNAYNNDIDNLVFMGRSEHR